MREASLPCSMDGVLSGSAVPFGVVAVCLEMKSKKCFLERLVVGGYFMGV